MIALTNLNTLIPRLFDLLHKAQRTIHLNTLETVVAMVSRYHSQFTQQSANILKEITQFVTEADLQASALALRLANHILAINNQGVEIQGVIAKACLLAKSPLIQGQALQELLAFFAAASAVNAIKDNTIAELYSYVSLQS